MLHLFKLINLMLITINQKVRMLNFTNLHFKKNQQTKKVIMMMWIIKIVLKIKMNS